MRMIKDSRFKDSKIQRFIFSLKAIITILRTQKRMLYTCPQSGYIGIDINYTKEFYYNINQLGRT